MSATPDGGMILTLAILEESIVPVTGRANRTDSERYGKDTDE